MCALSLSLSTLIELCTYDIITMHSLDVGSFLISLKPLSFGVVLGSVSQALSTTLSPYKSCLVQITMPRVNHSGTNVMNYNRVGQAAITCVYDYAVTSRTNNDDEYRGGIGVSASVYMYVCGNLLCHFALCHFAV